MRSLATLAVMAAFLAAAPAARAQSEGLPTLPKTKASKKAAAPADLATGQSLTFEATGKVGKPPFPGLPADALFLQLQGCDIKGLKAEPKGGPPPFLNLDQELEGPLVSQLKQMKDQNVSITGTVSHLIPNKDPNTSMKLVLNVRSIQKLDDQGNPVGDPIKAPAPASPVASAASGVSLPGVTAAVNGVTNAIAGQPTSSPGIGLAGAVNQTTTTTKLPGECGSPSDICGTVTDPKAAKK